MIYGIAGVPYVAVAGGMKNTVTQQTDSGPALVSILALPQVAMVACDIQTPWKASA